MFKPQHSGLVFTEAHVKAARKHRSRTPFKEAWHLLDVEELTGADAVLFDGLRFRFNADVEAGERAVANLREPASSGDTVVRQDEAHEADYVQMAAETLRAAQSFELLREHPAYSAASQRRWQDALAARVDWLQERLDKADTVARAWLAAVNAGAAVVLEAEARMDAAVSVVKSLVDDEVHPEGYLRNAVQVGPEVRSLRNQVQGVQALALAAEIAQHAGIDLWGYANRGVSIITAATYPLYYYFYPEQWRWNGEEWRPSSGVPAEDAEQLFKTYAGFVEIINRKYHKPLRAAKLILSDLRPVFDPFGGGLVTLSHGQPERRGLFD